LFAGDLLLHVAKYEGLPFAIAEAMAAGLPCAVTRNFAAEVPILNQDNVLFLDDAQALASRLRDSEALSRIAAGGRRLVEKKLSVSAMVDAYERLYLEAIQE
jgi:glycosyltransferase involved in cell wall biosynthesis